MPITAYPPASQRGELPRHLDYRLASTRVKDAIIARRGAEARGIAKTAAARILLAQVFYAMRDGHVRRAPSQAA